MPPAALISILQKGLQYVEAEISINEVCSFLRMWQSSSLSLAYLWRMYMLLIYGSGAHSKVLGKSGGYRQATAPSTSFGCPLVWVCRITRCWLMKTINSFYLQTFISSPSALHEQTSSLSDFPGQIFQTGPLLDAHGESVFCVKLTGGITKGKLGQQFFITFYLTLHLLHSFSVPLLLQCSRIEPWSK